MTYEILDHISRADIAFRVRGSDLEDLFSAGGAALTGIMLRNPKSVRFTISVSFTCESPEIELLYFDFLSEFIYYKDTEKLLLVPDSVLITPSYTGYALTCHARGETIERDRHFFSVDIKAITMHKLSIVKEKSGWQATVVVDV